MCCVKRFKSALLYRVVTQAGAGSRKSIKDCNIDLSYLIMLISQLSLITLALLGPTVLFKPL